MHDWTYPEDDGPAEAPADDQGWTSEDDGPAEAPADDQGWTYPEDPEDEPAAAGPPSSGSFMDLPVELQFFVLSRLCSVDLCSVALTCKAMQWAVADLPAREPVSELAQLCHLAHTITRVKANESIQNIAAMASKLTSFAIRFRHEHSPVRPPKRRRLGTVAPAGPPWRKQSVSAAAVLPAADFFQAPFDRSAAACETVEVDFKVTVDDDGYAVTAVAQSWKVYAQGQGRARALVLHLEARDGTWRATTGRKATTRAASANSVVAASVDVLGSLMKTCCMFRVPQDGIATHTGACLLSAPVLRCMLGR